MSQCTSLSVAFGGSASATPQAAMTNPFGFVDYTDPAGDSGVRLARAVAVAQTAGGADGQQAVVRLRQNTEDAVTASFYRVDDFNGTINGLAPGQAGYDTAVNGRLYATGDDISVISGPGYGYYKQLQLTGIDSDDLVAMRLTSGGHNFYGFSAANESVNGSGVTHLWNYGLNTWGWESTFGGGDQDYNDLVVQLDFTSASGSGWLVQDASTGGGDDVIYGNDEADSMVGGHGNDAIYGAGGADTLYGGLGDDLVFGQDGDDIVDTGAGNDIAEGGAGTDTLVFNSRLADTAVNRDGAYTLIVGPEGQDRYIGFERFQFTDATVVTADGAPLVDDLFYLANYKDVLAAVQDADDHYATYGWKEGRDPNALFSTTGYLAATPDSLASSQNPLEHYDQAGWKQGRDPSASFDNELYLAHNPDVKAAGLNPLKHYIEYGQGEGRAIYDAIGKTADLAEHPGFDAEYYLLSNLDVARAATTSGKDAFAYAYEHYQIYGWKEGRNPNAVFDTKGYLDAYQDVKAAGIDPLMHYDQYGWKEGRDPSKGFDSTAYLGAYGDIVQAKIDPMQHYLQYGAVEGRERFADTAFGAGNQG